MNVNLYELMGCRVHFVSESLTSHVALCLFCGRVFVNLTSAPDSFSNALRLVAGGIHQPLDSELVALPIVAGLGPLISRSTRRQPARAHAQPGEDVAVLFASLPHTIWQMLLPYKQD